MSRSTLWRSSAIRLGRIAVCVVALVLGIDTAFALPPAIPLSPDRQVALGVRLAPVAVAHQRSLQLPAHVLIPAQAQWLASVAASTFVHAVLVQNGSEVRRGQALLQLQGGDIAMLQRDYNDAQARYRLAQQQSQRDELLYREGVIPQVRVQQTRLAAAEAAHALAERRLALQALGAGAQMSGQAVLRAARAGTVSDLSVVPGQRVDPGQSLLRVVDGNAVYLQIAVAAEQGRQIPVGAQVEIPEAGAKGRIQSKSPELGMGQQQQLQVRLERRGSLEAGQTVTAKVLLPTSAQSWRLPASAVTQMAGQSVVFVQQQGGFRVVPVRLVGRGDGQVVVTGPLRVGEQVAAAGVIAIQTAAGEVQP
ncbi:MAG: efflux RND transporter periplasmic adaptor subunit [Candidatus Igneacidithiobacillus chanchocoensis]